MVTFGPIETDLVARRLSRCAGVDDLRRIAKRRLPGGVFDYIDGGAEDELTMDENAAAFRQVRWQPRVLTDVSAIDTSVELLGRRIPLPLVLAPTGFTRIAHPQGELAVARAGAKVGIPYCLSTLATRSIEDVAAAADAVGGGPRWFQIYVWRDRGLVKEMVRRAEEHGYEALMVTVDTAVFGRRERDVRRGFTLPPSIGPGTLIDGALHPAWSLAFVRAEPITFANISDDASRDGSTAVTLADFINDQFDPTLNWDDLAWLRSITDLPIILKGIQSVADARQAVNVGLPAVLLSNHGGRQLDRSPTPLRLLPAVRDAVGDDLEVLIDGGVRRGADLVAARALGATACMIGRPYLYALGAAGERGVDWLLDRFDADTRRTMALLGQTKMMDIDDSALAAE